MYALRHTSNQTVRDCSVHYESQHLITGEFMSKSHHVSSCTRCPATNRRSAATNTGQLNHRPLVQRTAAFAASCALVAGNALAHGMRWDTWITHTRDDHRHDAHDEQRCGIQPHHKRSSRNRAAGAEGRLGQSIPKPRHWPGNQGLRADKGRDKPTDGRATRADCNRSLRRQ